jgi:ribosome biogenesis GTPase
MSDRFDFEENYFLDKDRKEARKERKRLTDADRSKFKKSDQKKEEKTLIDESLRRGRVMAISGEGAWVESEGAQYLCILKGILKKEKRLAKNLIAVGDYVRFEPTSGKDGSIAHIEERFSTLARTDISGKKEQLIAANIDQVFIIVSVVEPPLKPALIDRYLIAAAKGNLHPIIVVNKADLLTQSGDEAERYKEFLAAYEPLGFPILSMSSKTGAGIEAIRSLMKDKTSVISGQSGVGKSSLLNTAFQLELRIGDLAIKTVKGSHTTTVALLIPLPGGGYCIDTPGIRSFGVWRLSRKEVAAHFTDIADLSEKCHFPDCMHVSEPKCAVLKALHDGDLPLMRYESYSTLLEEALGGIDNRMKRKMGDGLDG